MTRKIEAIVCDVDGTMYPFVNSADATYGRSLFAGKVQENIRRSIADTLAVSMVDAEVEFVRLTEKYGEDYSIAFEREYKIPRQEFFDRNWSIDPSDFVPENTGLRPAFKRLDTKKAILSSAPRVWVSAVLERLLLADIFSNDLICTGESDVRKPQTRAFAQVRSKLAVPYERIVSIGDQETTDILPAKKLGMTTIRIGEPEWSAADYVVSDILCALRLVEELSL